MPDKNDLNWEDYEAITQYIYGALGEQQGIKVIGYGQNCKVKGKSGVNHQIDVLTEQQDGGKALRTAIECKFLKQKVNKEIVMKLQAIMNDAGIETVIIVCKAGFTRDTLQYAEHQGIKLVELSEAREDDPNFQKVVELGIIDLNFNIVRSRGKVTCIELGSKIITGEKEIFAMWYVQLHDGNGGTISFGEFLKAFSAEVQRRGGLLKNTTIVYPLTKTLYWNKIAIEKVTITGFFEQTDLSSKKSFRLTDQVWMIMNELFDKRRLTLSKSGLIWNLPPEGL
jgi:hypothetical protein